jgi:predicted anti-sigma-YlaC factor YlaD
MTIKQALKGACKRYEEDLVLHYYGEIAESERVRVERHLADCDACRRFSADLRRLLPQMSLTQELPKSFWDDYYRQTMTKLTQYEEKKNGWRSWLTPLSGWMMPAFGTLSAAVLVVGLMYGKDHSKRIVDPAAERIPQEIMLDQNQLEFFKSMHILEALSNLEDQEEPKGEGPRTDREQAGGATAIA